MTAFNRWPVGGHDAGLKIDIPQVYSITNGTCPFYNNFLPKAAQPIMTHPTHHPPKPGDRPTRRRQAIRYAAWLLAACGCLIGKHGLALGGEFQLTHASGAAYSLSDSHGKAVVLSFGYTFCPDICPTTLATVAAALTALGADADRVDAFLITLDPARDTPEKLSAYAAYFHPRLGGLTGAPQDIAAVAQQYGVQAKTVRSATGDHYTLDHTANLYIIDTQGALFSIMPHGLPPAVLAANIRSALRAGEP